MEKNVIFRLFPAFESKNYQYYFLGQLISQIGSWLQIVSEGWLVLQLTNSAFLIGLVAACATLPSLLFSLFGGVIVDRFDKKKLMYVTQSCALVLALTVGTLTLLHLINVWEIAVFAFLLGAVSAIDNPARQAFVYEMVGPEKMSSAIALNSGMFNTARVIGPTLAGILIVFVGVGGAYILNSISYIAALIALYLIIPMVHKERENIHPIQAIKDGVSYTWSHPVIRSLIALTGVVSIFGWSYSTLMPFIAKNIYHQGAAGLGYLYAAAGLGAVVATIFVSTFSEKINPLFFIIGGNTLFALSVIGFSYTHTVLPAYFFLFLGGVGLLAEFAVINARIQHLVENKFRGRVLSVYLLVFIGLFPIGNFQVGFISEHWGVQFAIRFGAIIVLLAGIGALFLRSKVAAAHEIYLNRNEVSEGTREVMRDSNKP
jgi:MFS family permease